MSLPFVTDAIGTTKAYFKIGLGATAARLKNNTAVLEIKNAVDNAFLALKALKVTATGADIELNSAAQLLTLSANPSQASALQVIMPSGKGTDGQVLAQKAGAPAGVVEFEFISAGPTTQCGTFDTTTLAFGSASTVAMFNLPATGEIQEIKVMVDTAFNGTAPTMSIGIAGSTSKYVASGDVDLTTQAGYKLTPGMAAAGSVEALIITYAAGASSAGSARIVVTYATPV